MSKMAAAARPPNAKTSRPKPIRSPSRPEPVRSPSRPERIRSLLYTPADRPDRYGKAWADGIADAVCADLEDAVAPASKAAARKSVVEALRSPGGRCLRAVRVNPIGSREHEADLKAVLAAGPDLLVVPKVESAEALRELAARVEREALGPTRLVAILETARGVVAAREICAAAPLAAVCFGAEDLAAEVGMRKGPDSAEVAMARQWVVLCAAAAGVPALDMITADYKDAARTEREARDARALGYAGKMCVHPAQVAIVHDAFRPTRDEVAWAEKVMAEVDRKGLARGGVASVDGRMVDVPVIRQARRILADARA
jgi:citrate lyase subunit beta/citryl-CoA lyase